MRKKTVCMYICIILLIPLLSTAAVANQPPSAPDINGPNTATPGSTKSYGICSTDPDQDEITYCVDFGDGTGEVCVGPFPNGVCGTVDHTWSSKGSFTITATATDSHGATSDPSTLIVSVTQSKLLRNMFFLQFLQSFPILRLILGL